MWWWALKSAMIIVGILLLKRLLRSVYGMVVLGLQYVVAMIIGPANVLVLMARKWGLVQVVMKLNNMVVLVSIAMPS